MAFCTNCGGQIADGAKFCTNCGAPQNPHMQPGQAESAPESYIQEANPQDMSSQGPDTQAAFGADFGSNASASFDNAGSTAGPAFDAGSSAGSYTGSYTSSTADSYGSAGGYGTSGAGSMNPQPTLTIVEAVQNCFSKYASFSGRARRSEYWYFMLFNFVAQIVLGIVGNLIFGAPESGGLNMLQSVYSLAVLVPGMAVFWRRMHDIGKSGAWYFLNFVPLIGQIVLIIFAARDSEPGENKFGMSPKYPG